MEEKRKLTQEYKEQLEKELEHLIVVRSKEIEAKIGEARAQGDLSENAEYDAAKDEQGRIAAKIKEIQDILKNHVIIDSTSIKILDMELGEEQTISIVGTDEADVLNGKISDKSPLGMALKDKKKGDVVEVEAPNNCRFAFKILEISKPKKTSDKSKEKKED